MKRFSLLLIIPVLLLQLFAASSCNATVKQKEASAAEQQEKENNNTEEEKKAPVTMPEEEDYSAFTNENYAASEPYIFEGTIDEIYEDKSMLIYSPAFYPDFNYMVFVEFDENTVVNGFEPKINQQVKFTIYEDVKKYPPLTVVAIQLDLVKEVSTQREEEKARLEELMQRVNELDLNK